MRPRARSLVSSMDSWGLVLGLASCRFFGSPVWTWLRSNGEIKGWILGN